jgi:hypothetical protein
MNEWRVFYTVELHDLYSSHNIVRMIKSRRMRWVGDVALMGEGRVMYRILVGKAVGRDHLVDPGLEGNIIFTRIFRMWDVGVWIGLSWLRIETGGGQL